MRGIKQRLAGNDAFSLIELMVVIALMAAVAMFAYPSLRGAQDNNNDKAAQTAIRATFEKIHSPYVDAGGSFNTTPAGVAQSLSAAARQDVQYTIRPYRDAATSPYQTSQVASSWLASAPNAQPPGPTSGPRDVSVWFDSDQQVTLCAFSQSGRVFCLRDNGNHALVGGDSAGEVSLSNATNERDARAALATTTAAAHNVGSPPTAVPGWSKRVDGTGSVSVPVNTAAPQITGTATAGSTLTASNGTWTGPAPITYTRQWMRCDTAGNNCADISAATAATYAVTSVDAGKTLRVAVVATNASGATSAISQPTATVSAVPPANVSAPTISATLWRDTWTVTATTGSWTSSTTPTYSYQWQRCSGTCVDIAGQTQSTYTLASADVNATVRVTVTATNAGGSTTSQSAQSSTITALPLMTGTAPDASGNGRNLPYARLYTSVQGAVTPGSAVTFQTSNNPWGQLSNPGAALSPGAGSFTVEGWLRFAPGNPGGSVINRYECGWNACSGLDGNASAVWQINLQSDGKLAWSVRADNDGTAQATSPVDSRDGTLHYVVAVLDRSASLSRLYIDGVQVASAAAGGVGSINDATSDLAVGWSAVAGTYGSVSQMTSMTVDDLALYKSALSPARIAAHYAARTDQTAYTNAVKADAPAAYWPF